MRVGRYMDMVDHEVNGVEEAVGKESGRCSNGGELGFRVGSFCKGRQVSGSRKYTKL
jgi:hypothetical protein